MIQNTILQQEEQPVQKERDRFETHSNDVITEESKSADISSASVGSQARSHQQKVVNQDLDQSKVNPLQHLTFLEMADIDLKI